MRSSTSSSTSSTIDNSTTSSTKSCNTSSSSANRRSRHSSSSSNNSDNDSRQHKSSSNKSGGNNSEHNGDDKRSSESICSLKQRLRALMALQENQRCCDCTEKKPTRALLLTPLASESSSEICSIGAFCCFHCSSSHQRSIGKQGITRVKDTALDEWKEHEVRAMELGGNKILNQIYEGKLVDNMRKSTPASDIASRDDYITDKYANRLYFDEMRYSELTTTSTSSSSSTKERVTFSAKPSYHVDERKSFEVVPTSKPQSTHDGPAPADWTAPFDMSSPNLSINKKTISQRQKKSTSPKRSNVNPRVRASKPMIKSNSLQDVKPLDLNNNKGDLFKRNVTFHSKDVFINDAWGGDQRPKQNATWDFPKSNNATCGQPEGKKINNNVDGPLFRMAAASMTMTSPLSPEVICYKKTKEMASMLNSLSPELKDNLVCQLLLEVNNKESSEQNDQKTSPRMKSVKSMGALSGQRTHKRTSKTKSKTTNSKGIDVDDLLFSKLKKSTEQSKQPGETLRGSKSFNSLRPSKKRVPRSSSRGEQDKDEERKTKSKDDLNLTMKDPQANTSPPGETYQVGLNDCESSAQDTRSSLSGNKYQVKLKDSDERPREERSTARKSRRSRRSLSPKAETSTASRRGTNRGSRNSKTETSKASHTKFGNSSQSTLISETLSGSSTESSDESKRSSHKARHSHSGTMGTPSSSAEGRRSWTPDDTASKSKGRKKRASSIGHVSRSASDDSVTKDWEHDFANTGQQSFQFHQSFHQSFNLDESSPTGQKGRSSSIGHVTSKNGDESAARAQKGRSSSIGHVTSDKGDESKTRGRKNRSSSIGHVTSNDGDESKTRGRKHRSSSIGHVTSHDGDEPLTRGRSRPSINSDDSGRSRRSSSVDSKTHRSSEGRASRMRRSRSSSAKATCRRRGTPSQDDQHKVSREASVARARALRARARASADGNGDESNDRNRRRSRSDCKDNGLDSTTWHEPSDSRRSRSDNKDNGLDSTTWHEPSGRLQRTSRSASIEDEDNNNSRRRSHSLSRKSASGHRGPQRSQSRPIDRLADCPFSHVGKTPSLNRDRSDRLSSSSDHIKKTSPMIENKKSLNTGGRILRRSNSGDIAGKSPQGRKFLGGNRYSSTTRRDVKSSNVRVNSMLSEAFKVCSIQPDDATTETTGSTSSASMVGEPVSDDMLQLLQQVKVTEPNHHHHNDWEIN